MIHTAVLEEDLTRETLHRLIQRIDEELYAPEEAELEDR